MEPDLVTDSGWVDAWLILGGVMLIVMLVAWAIYEGRKGE